MPREAVLYAAAGVREEMLPSANEETKPANHKEDSPTDSVAGDEHDEANDEHEHEEDDVNATNHSTNEHDRTAAMSKPTRAKGLA